MGNYIPNDCTVILADAKVQDDKSSPEVTQQAINSLLNVRHMEQVIEVDEASGKTLKRNESYSDSKILSLYEKLPLPQILYNHVRVDLLEQIVLVIGGEADGLCAASYKLAHDHGGIRAYIPLANGVDSLNAGAAFAVLAYELRRQLTELRNLNGRIVPNVQSN